MSGAPTEMGRYIKNYVYSRKSEFLNDLKNFIEKVVYSNYIMIDWKIVCGQTLVFVHLALTDLEKE